MIWLDDQPVAAVERCRPLSVAVSRQRMPFPGREPQVREGLGLLKQRHARLQLAPPLIPKVPPARLVRRTGPRQLVVEPRDLDVSLRTAQVYNPRGYTSDMAY